MKLVRSKSLVQVRNSDCFTLATARKESNLETAENLIAEFVVELANNLNLMGKVSEYSIMAIAEDVYEIGYYLNIEELAYFFRQLRKGKYGSMYENLNSEKVCIALDKFLIDRANYFEGKNIGGHNEKTGRPDVRVNETSAFRDISKGFLNKFNSEK